MNLFQIIQKQKELHNQGPNTHEICLSFCYQQICMVIFLKNLNIFRLLFSTDI